MLAKFKTYTEKNAAKSFVEYLAAINWCAANLPDTARVACRKPELFYIYSKGRKSGGIPQYASPEAVLEGFEKNRIDYIIIDHWFRHAYVTVVPAIQKYSDRFAVVHQIGGDPKDETPATYIVKMRH